jgi:hypothetical protein
MLKGSINFHGNTVDECVNAIRVAATMIEDGNTTLTIDDGGVGYDFSVVEGVQDD